MTDRSGITLLHPSDAPPFHDDDIERLALLIERKDASLDEVVALIARVAAPIDVLSD